MNFTPEPNLHRYSIKESTLRGSVSIAGAKNSVLRLMAASILTNEKVKIRNYPSSILDASIQKGMLEALGKSVEVIDDTICISENQDLVSDLEWNQRSIRNTLIVGGALLARFGHARIPLPGGCLIGDRKIDLHEMVFRSMGAIANQEGNYLILSAGERLKAAEIFLPIRSTGATENAIICGSLARGKTVVWNPHVRPEIVDLVEMMNKMGGKIKVFGQQRIEIEGVESLYGVEHTAILDNIEALTWVVGAAMTQGEVEIVEFPFESLEVPLAFLNTAGVRLFRDGKTLLARGGGCYPIEISTGPYPGINSDMQPLFSALGSISKGTSKIVDLRFPDRFGYAKEMNKLGINAEVRSGRLEINGGYPIRGCDVTALDLRTGAALTLLGLVATGTTNIHNAWQIERGYDQFVNKLKSLGANIDVSSNNSIQ